MAKLVSTDFDELADSINGIAGRFIPTARATGQWSIQLVQLGRLWVQQLHTGGATTFAGDGTANVVTLAVPLSAPGKIYLNGDPLTDDSFILVRKDLPFTASARQAVHWVGLTLPADHSSLPPELLDALTSRVKGGRGSTHTQTARTHLTALQSLLSGLCAHDGAGLALDAVATRAAEEELLAVVAQTVAASSAVEYEYHIGRPRYCRELVIGRVLALMDANRGKPLFLQDLCDATRVSQRTLRNVFHEHFGVGPMKLLKVRQLCDIRSALLAADPNEVRVAEITRRFGVRDYSLFTRHYKALYSELPSQTLQRGTRDRDGNANSKWLEYALRRFSGGEDDFRFAETPGLRADPSQPAF